MELTLKFLCSREKRTFSIGVIACLDLLQKYFHTPSRMGAGINGR
jgi:hypothetical protein